MFKSPFDTETPQTVTEIPKDAEIVFVSDLFVDEYVGGAELTSQALIDSSPLNVFKLKSKDVNLKTLESGVEKYWIFGNFAGMNMSLIPSIVANMKYSILEYDYKYCKHRSPEKHEFAEVVKCNCHDEINGKMISAFFYGAKSLWWMSERQMDRYHRLFPFLKERENVVLSSVFDDSFFLKVKMLKAKYKDVERKGWIALGSSSWIKGAEDAVLWCDENDLEHEVLWGLAYDDVLEKLVQAEGFVYLPRGGDTCPRMVIEAQLLGCKLEINDSVEHASEIWFDTEDMFDTEAYLYAARERFWNSIKETMNYSPTLSGYTTTLNCNRHGYPWRQSITSMLGFCNEVVVVDGGSTDETWAELEKWAEKESKLKVYKVVRDWAHPRFAVFDGAQKAEARKLCTGEYCWQQDADEVVHENDYEKILRMIRVFPTHVNIVSLPVVEYWGSDKKVRMDVNPWKWRLSRNEPYITHGIPKQFQKFDEEGNMHASLGTDGCDYIHNENYEVLAHASFYTHEAHELRTKGLTGDKKSLDTYKDWFSRNVDMLPSVYHYSWFDLERKIKTYRDYWSQHWQSLYNIKQDDTSENNMFFDKSWKDVTDDDIKILADKLSNEMGGWVFHSKVDFSTPTPYLSLNKDQPELMKNEKC